MENELNISLDGIPNINDVSNFSMKLEILGQLVQRHAELRDLCHKEFVRRMENVMARRRSLLERRRLRQNMEKATNEQAEKRVDKRGAEESVVKLNDNVSGKSDKNIENLVLPDIKNSSLDRTQKQHKKKVKTVEFEDSQDFRIQHHKHRGKSRNSIGASSNGSKSSSKTRGRFRKVSLAVGGVVRISSKRRNTYPVEASGGLYVGKSPNTESPRGKISPGSSLNEQHGNGTPNSNRGKPHLAVTRQAINTNARSKVKDIMTRVKVVKTFQGSVRKDETKTASVRVHEQK